jgi:hypothetical protein
MMCTVPVSTNYFLLHSFLPDQGMMHVYNRIYMYIFYVMALLGNLAKIIRARRTGLNLSSGLK